MRPSDFGTLTLMGALWGASYLFIRVGVPDFGPAPLMAGRVVLAALVLWIALRAAGRRVVVRPYAGRLLFMGLFNAALPFTLVAFAELDLNASLVAVLGATVPLFGAIVGAIWLRDRVTPLRGAGLLLGMVGVAVLTGFSPVALDRAAVLGIGATLLASLSYAVAGFYAKRKLAGVPAGTLALGQQLGAVAWLALPATLMLPEATPSTGAMSALAGLAVLSTALAFVLFFRMIERIGPMRTQTVAYIVPAFGMLWGVLLLGEKITGGMLAGFGLILVSMLMVNGVYRRGEAIRPRQRESGAAPAAVPLTQSR